MDVVVLRAGLYIGCTTDLTQASWTRVQFPEHLALNNLDAKSRSAAVPASRGLLNRSAVAGYPSRAVVLRRTTRTTVSLRTLSELPSYRVNQPASLGNYGHQNGTRPPRQPQGTSKR